MDCNRPIDPLFIASQNQDRYDTQINVETQRLQRHDRFSFVASVRSTRV